MRNLTNDFDKIIIKWLRSGDENATNLAVMLNDFVQAEIDDKVQPYLVCPKNGKRCETPHHCNVCVIYCNKQCSGCKTNLLTK